jgi:hypothetical protein
MSAKSHNAIRVKEYRATRPFRKKILVPGIASGTITVRIVGSKGIWHIYGQRGRTLHRLSETPFPTQTQASHQALAQYHVTKVTVYKGKPSKGEAAA